MGKVMADSISYLPEMEAWYNVIMDELATIDLSKLLVYMVDTVEVVALPFLGSQFDVLGYKGFRLATSDDDKRSIVKRAIELHRYKGTEWAIKEALKSIGFADVVLLRGYDHWAKFGILLTTENIQMTDSSFADITAMIEEYKRAVCVLAEIRINILVSDVLSINDDQAMVNAEIMNNDKIILSGATKYDGEIEFDASSNFSGEGDVFTMTQI
jgi:P2-related tail formation protein